MAGPSVDSLFPAIAQSFVVIIIGYAFGFFNLIPSKESKSIGTLVGKLFLPALLFKNLALLNLSSVSWPFLGGMLVAKFSVFAAVVILTMIVTRPFGVGNAGLFGIFATQSNDFALGLPIVTAVYGESTGTHNTFDYVSYIYLLAPVSLAIINPIGFALMEYHKQVSRKKLTCKQVPLLILRTLRGVVLNPIIFMTVLGLLVNVIVYFGVHKGEGESMDNLPDWLVAFLDVLGGAYSACALFQIGLFMVGKLKKVTGSLLLIATLLILAKTVILPFIAYRVLYSVLPDGVFNSTREDVSTFGFLLGTFPTAPTVFVYASQYNLAMEIVAASLVLCTFFSAPIMYLSARMVLVAYTTLTNEDYEDVIADCRSDVSIVTCISVAFVFLLFMFARRYRSYAHVFIMHLMVAMLIEVIGVDLLGLVTGQHLVYWEFFYFSIFFIGVLATRTWMASTAFGLLLLITKGPHKAEKAWVPLMLVSWGVPVCITVLMVSIRLADQTASHKALVDISFLFGEIQFILSLVVLIICFIVGAVCVIIIILATRKMNRTNKKDRVALEETKQSSPERQSTTAPSRRSPQSYAVNYGAESLNSNSNGSSYGATPLLKREDTPVFVGDPPGGATIDFNSPLAKKATKDELSSEKTPLLRRDVSPEPSSVNYSLELPTNSSGLWYRDKSGQHLMRFIVLIIFLLFSSFVGILILIWKLSSPQITGIFIAVNVLDTVTNFGQGFFVLAVFGFEKHWFWIYLYSKLRQLFFKVETVSLPREDELEVSVLDLCRTFNERYKELCKEDIVVDKRYLLKTYNSVFSGAEFVDWLVRKGVSQNREDAVQYGHALMFGRVIAHVTDEHYFHDEPYFYRFMEKKD